ncbi:MAG: pyridoxamine 5'-phosphate oxidase family protein [Dehalococcoidia bacterium]
MSDRTKVRRVPDRGVYDVSTIREILDANFLCHLGITTGHGPVVLPTLYARDGDSLLLHGSAGAHTLREAKSGNPVCVTVAEVNGIVVARSAFHHSINYRSVVVFGVATEVVDVEEKLRAMQVLTNHMLPGRWDECRRPNSSEFTQTTLLRLPLDEASAKVRTGPPKDDEEDYALPTWAGVIPVRREMGGLVPDPLNAETTGVDSSVTAATEKWRTP